MSAANRVEARAGELRAHREDRADHPQRVPMNAHGAANADTATPPSAATTLGLASNPDVAREGRKGYNFRLPAW